MAVTGTGKKSIIKGIFATQASDYGQNAVSGPILPADNARTAQAKLQVQAEVDARAALRRARGVVEDDESGHA